MREDWRAGDLALCIRGKRWKFKGRMGPVCGQICTVRRVGLDEEGTLGLWFNEFPGDRCRDGFWARAFIKVTPPAEMIEQERKAGRGRERAR
jgi:hypothetical protein